jgi:hypothetical protein
VNVERIGGEGIGMPTPIRRVVVASFIGTTIEWYDFFYLRDRGRPGFSCPVPPAIFPLAGTLASFVTFTVGFLARVIEASDFWRSRFERGSQLGILRENIRASGRFNFGHRAMYCG